ncbi:hypothetical protein V1264_005113 [Littorina saxatilis]|uniref:Uncharacterized protein n=2 Tax=Littorina saxatilis TaxID=31220 RepID=A0AAN9AZ51_9CAEN
MANYGRTFGFGMQAFKKYPELIPLATITGTACVGAAGYVAYALTTKPDVRFNKSSELPPWERVRPNESRKMRVVNRSVYRADPEVQQLRDEINSFRG